jgi:hypothetical protein
VLKEGISRVLKFEILLIQLLVAQQGAWKSHQVRRVGTHGGGCNVWKISLPGSGWVCSILEANSLFKV